MSSLTRALVKPTCATRAGRAVLRVAEPFTFRIGRIGSGIGITVPASFESDLALVPWWA